MALLVMSYPLCSISQEQYTNSCTSMFYIAASEVLKILGIFNTVHNPPMTSADMALLVTSYPLCSISREHRCSRYILYN